MKFFVNIAAKLHLDRVFSVLFILFFVCNSYSVFSKVSPHKIDTSLFINSLDPSKYLKNFFELNEMLRVELPNAKQRIALLTNAPLERIVTDDIIFSTGKEEKEIYPDFGSEEALLDAELFDFISIAYFSQQKVDSAIYYARLAKKVAGNDLLLRPVAIFNLNYADLLFNSGKVDSSLILIKNVIDINKKQQSENLEILGLAYYYLANLERKQGKGSSVIASYKNAFNSTFQANDRYYLSPILDSMQSVYLDDNNFKSAYEIFKLKYDLKDKLRKIQMNEERKNSKSFLEKKKLADQVFVAQQNTKISKVRTESSKQMRVGFIALVSALLFIFVYVISKNNKRKQKSKLLKSRVEERRAALELRSKQFEEQTIKLKAVNEELERFAYIASHDLKTPLRNISSFLGLVRRRLPEQDKEAVGEYVDIALDNAKQMHHLVTDVLEFSKVYKDSNVKCKEVTISDIVQSSMLSMKNEIDSRNASITCDGDAVLYLPAGTLEQVLGNLLSNAIKYNKSSLPYAKVVVVDMGDTVRVTVTDNGIGISEEYYKSIFEVFKRLHTSEEFEGTGVGLASVKKVVDRVGGVISVESEINVGTTFTVDFPKTYQKALNVNEAVEVVAQQ